MASSSNCYALIGGGFRGVRLGVLLFLGERLVPRLYPGVYPLRLPQRLAVDFVVLTGT